MIILSGTRSTAEIQWFQCIYVFLKHVFSTEVIPQILTNIHIFSVDFLSTSIPFSGLIFEHLFWSRFEQIWVTLWRVFGSIWASFGAFGWRLTGCRHVLGSLVDALAPRGRPLTSNWCHQGLTVGSPWGRQGVKSLSNLQLLQFGLPPGWLSSISRPYFWSFSLLFD